MYRTGPFWLLTAGMISLAAIYGLDATTDPFGASVTRVERGYHHAGQISHETSLNRFGEMHGPQVHFNCDGQIIVEAVYEHGEWVIHRDFNYARGTMTTYTSTWTPPYVATVTTPIPAGYEEYRCTDRRTDVP